MTDFDILIKLYSTTDFVIPSQVSGPQQAEKHVFSAETVRDTTAVGMFH